MSTRGFIGIKSNDKTLAVYNHSDSYPTWLGERVFEQVQKIEDFAEFNEKFEKLIVVDEGDSPTLEQLADLKERGFWQNVSTGEDWYAALREAQGNLGAYLEAGYIPGFDPQSAIDGDGSWMEWGYVIDLDAMQIVVYELSYNEPAKNRVFPIDEVLKMNGGDIVDLMAELQEWE